MKNKNYFARIKQTLLILLSAFVCFLFTAYPEETISSVRRALDVCAENVIASLFPFLFLSSFIAQSDLLNFKSGFIFFPFEKIFGAKPECLTVLILSALGGFPVGAKTAEAFLEKGKISENSAKRLIISCVNPSPAFAVSTIGIALFSSKRLGLIIYLSVVISNLLIFFVSRFIFDDDKPFCAVECNEKIPLSSCFISAGRASSEAMISICCYVIIFSCLCETASVFIGNENILNIICSIFEVTAGTKKLCAAGNIPLIAGVTGWGGISVHCQILSSARRAGLDTKLIFASRALCAFLSVLLSDILMQIFPTVTDTVSLNKSLNMVYHEKSAAVSIMMLLTCFVFLLGDCRIRKRNVEKKAEI